ncbi:hypothetical protein BKI52_04350 [marine bacterium AO1-C]|nr:hypothetical protein BKI52_04350 [marine bacterium AO1-C]
MSDLAKKLIEENLRTQDPFLDLGNCGLDGTEPVLEMLRECGHLEELTLSNMWDSFGSNYETNNVRKKSTNKGNPNQLICVPHHLPKHLKKIILSGDGDDKNNERGQIQDLTAISHLEHLTHLNLSYNYIKNLAPLKKLSKLQELVIYYNEIQDISALNSLRRLQILILNLNNIEDITPLRYLINLKTLALLINNIQDLSVFNHLRQLQVLDLSDNNLSDLSALSNLRQLEVLYIMSNKIKDLDALRNLTQLRHLGARNNKIQNIDGLEKLDNLTNINLWENQIKSINPISQLKKLESLDLRDNKIQDIHALKDLKRLQHLNLNTNQLWDISSIKSLRNLTWLNVGDNQLSMIDLPFLEALPKLEYLCVNNNPLTNIPSEIYQKDPFYDPDSSLLSIKAYLNDLAQGQTKVYQAKVILIGNGRTGKTSLVKRWLEDDFDPDEDSTHAIQLRTEPLAPLAEAKGLDQVQLNIWDFGGQDIYHATHRLFMQTQAVFVLVWDAETEASPTQTETLEDGSVVAYQNHSLVYWLNYAKVLGKGSPVLVVQTKKEEHGEKLPDNWQELKQQYNIVARIAVDSALDNEDENGFSDLKHYLHKTIRQQIDKACTDLPTSWWKVRQAIEQLQGQSQKTLTQKAFSHICKQQPLSKGSQVILQKYLHDTGFFFYRSGLFHNEIIIDQQWAIDAVYTLFDRKRAFMKYQGKGFFKGEDLQLSWGDKPKSEQMQLISFMESCKICVEVSDYWGGDSEDLPFAQCEYLAPQLLPDELIPNQVDIFPKEGKGIYIKIRHAFLHAGIMQSFTVSRAKYAERDNLKQQRIYFETFGQKVLVEAFPAQKEIIVRLPPSNLQQKDITKVIHQIRTELGSIDQNLTDTEEMVSIDGQGYINWQTLQNHPSQNPQIRADNGQWYAIDDFAVFRKQSEKQELKHLSGASEGFSELQPQKALQCLEQGNYAGYFAALPTHLLPEDKRGMCNQLKKRFISGRFNEDFEEQLWVFVQLLLEGGKAY